jgi:hypothetical protein
LPSFGVNTTLMVCPEKSATSVVRDASGGGCCC